MYAQATFRIYLGSNKEINWVMLVPFWFFMYDRLPSEYNRQAAIAAIGAVLAVGAVVFMFVTST